MANSKKFILPESEIPTQWYNIIAEMETKPQPMINPETREPLKAEDLFPLFSEELSRQEVNHTDTWIDIPEEVRDKYKIYSIGACHRIRESFRYTRSYLF